MTVRFLKLATQDKFVTLFSAGNPLQAFRLKDWIAYYELAELFKQPQQDAIVARDFMRLAASDKAAAIQQLIDAARPLAGTSETDVSIYCVPSKEPTWNEDALQDQLINLRDSLIRTGLENSVRELDMESPIGVLYDSFGPFDDGPTQLQKVAMGYDLLRASLGLPVVPGRANLVTALDRNNENRYKKAKNSKWYKALQFPEGMEASSSSLLCVEDRSVVCTGHTMPEGIYFHPSTQNHPWIDRAFVATHPDTEEQCLVLAQDKTNAEGFSTAVDNLNAAAEMLSAATGISDVLCIANVIGASNETIKQKKFNYPYILVRETEVNSFYTPHFAPMVQFTRDRRE